jgi:hypothetical protein
VAAGWVRDVEGALGRFGQLVEGWLAELRHDAAAALDAVVRDLVDPVIRWVERAESWIATHLDHWWDIIYRDVIAPIVAEVKTIYHWADTFWDWYWKVAKDEVELLIKAADWIEWFAKHPFTAIEDAGKDLAHEFSLATIERQAGAMEDQVDGWADDFAKLLS